MSDVLSDSSVSVSGNTVFSLYTCQVQGLCTSLTSLGDISSLTLHSSPPGYLEFTTWEVVITTSFAPSQFGRCKMELLYLF